MKTAGFWGCFSSDQHAAIPKGETVMVSGQKEAFGGTVHRADILTSIEMTYTLSPLFRAKLWASHEGADHWLSGRYSEMQNYFVCQG